MNTISADIEPSIYAFFINRRQPDNDRRIAALTIA